MGFFRRQPLYCSARAAGGPLLITVPSTGGGAAGKDRLTRYIREAIGVKI